MEMVPEAVLWSKLQTWGDRAFSITAPTLWDRDCTDLTTFRKNVPVPSRSRRGRLSVPSRCGGSGLSLSLREGPGLSEREREREILLPARAPRTVHANPTNPPRA
ncbi:hypothetical protein WMY93_018429 [Mugilogobius chulae]|uniref:Uncharacterized protein n=1 Tax=Mugilogobius chulae TaxID=88201 RepID=A0AAW0NNV8_9GOBI